MVKEVVRSKVGIVFHPAALAEAGLDIAEMANGTNPAKHPAPSVKPNPGVHPGNTQGDPDQADSEQQIYDQLALSKLWWILEVLPAMFSWQDAAGAWHRKLE
jgi:hypothetical protein